MICVSIQEPSFERCKEMMLSLAAKGADRIAELRADLCRFTPEQVSLLVAANPHTIVTSRVESDNPSLSFNRLCAAIEAGAEYIDTELEYPDDLQLQLRNRARSAGTKLIVSWHNFSTTPPLKQLLEVYRSCAEKGADVVKIVTTANSLIDATRTMRLYRSVARLPRKRGNRPPLAAFAMGSAGKFTRYLSLKIGSPLSYTYPDGAITTAPGQYSESQLAALLEPGKTELPSLLRAPGASTTAASRENTATAPLRERRSIYIPCSKSHAQRAIIAAIYSRGKSVLENFQPCNDSAAALEVARQLGCRVEESNMQVTIESPGAEAIKNSLGERVTLHPGESGLLTRLLIPMACYFAYGQKRTVEISAEGSLLTRDITATVEAVENAGFNCIARREEGKSGLFMPCAISGREAELPEEIIIDGRTSSQIISGFLMALPLFKRAVGINSFSVASMPYILLTESVLEEFGIKVNSLPEHEGFRWQFSGREEYKAKEVMLQSDWSSAAYFLVAEAIRQSLKIGSAKSGELSFPNLKRETKQADEAILSILESCGCRIERKEMRIWAPPALKSFRADATNSPDLFPILAVLASFCEGRSSIKGVGRLAAKESNRAESIFSELSAIGANIQIQGDSMLIEGAALSGGEIRSYNDHRIAMSAAIAALFIENPVYINEIKCINKSFPTFFEVLKEYIKIIWQ
ncbi:MAG: type I 3-dehydroquinate dehydratase [Candidatus Egerieousia sp.]|nr:type I 3-dehydroquinate dehydratase [Candidatus Egerieousia sp.]